MKIIRRDQHCRYRRCEKALRAPFGKIGRNKAKQQQGCRERPRNALHASPSGRASSWPGAPSPGPGLGLDRGVCLCDGHPLLRRCEHLRPVTARCSRCQIGGDASGPQWTPLPASRPQGPSRFPPTRRPPPPLLLEPTARPRGARPEAGHRHANREALVWVIVLAAAVGAAPAAWCGIPPSAPG